MPTQSHLKTPQEGITSDTNARFSMYSTPPFLQRQNRSLFLLASNNGWLTSMSHITKMCTSLKSTIIHRTARWSLREGLIVVREIFWVMGDISAHLTGVYAYERDSQVESPALLKLFSSSCLSSSPSFFF